MSKEEALVELNALTQYSDIEVAHEEADKVLCEFLVTLGYKYIVDTYNRIKKWYA